MAWLGVELFEEAFNLSESQKRGQLNFSIANISYADAFVIADDRYS